jgi:hypothetical protein
VPSVPRLVGPMQGEYTGSVHAERKRPVSRVDALLGAIRYSIPEEDAGCGQVARSGVSESSGGETAG